MLTFIKCLFLSSTTLLTPEPVLLKQNLFASTDLIAMNEGAHLSLDISSSIVEGDIDKLNDFFPSGSIKAVLTSMNNQEINLIYKGGYSIHENKIFLLLRPDKAMTLGEYKSVKIHSDKPINNTSIYWSNCGK